ncbi:MAG: tetratricopeptide repeat protein [Candidatus Tantalella remota]|nr:tetratricopeptide repeat protein [Candidatus Tantalella remota]
MRHFFLISILFVHVAGLAGGLNVSGGGGISRAQGAFTEGNTAYENGDYEKAVEEYGSLAEKGFESGPLYYNLGNAYVKKGDIGKGILFYEKARQLMPRDGDLLANLRYAKSKMKRHDIPVKRPVVLRWLDMAMSYITIRQAVFAAFFLYYGMIALIIVTKVFKKTTITPTLPMLIMSFFLAIILIALPQKFRDTERGAITLSRITDVRLEPSDTAEPAFPLYEGMKVYILRQKGEWFKVKRTDGKVGWISSPNIEAI